MGGKSYLRPSKVFFAVEVHNEHVRWLHQLFLNTTGRNVDLVLMANTCSSTSASHLVTTECQPCSYVVPDVAIVVEAGGAVRTQPRV
jgi:hypothetical protein